MMFDHADRLATQRRDLAAELRGMTTAQRRDRVEHVAITTGGTLIPQRPSDNMGAHFAEIDMLDLYHNGETTDEAIANWMKAAARCHPQPHDRETAA